MVYSQVEESLSLYEETFDVVCMLKIKNILNMWNIVMVAEFKYSNIPQVLVEDQTFEFVNILLKFIFGRN